jgi:hypothetical protein
VNPFASRFPGQTKFNFTFASIVLILIASSTSEVPRDADADGNADSVTISDDIPNINNFTKYIRKFVSQSILSVQL